MSEMHNDLSWDEELSPLEKHLQRAADLRREKKWEQAVEEAKHALDIEPRCALAYQELAETFRAAGRLDEAKEAYYEALRIRPDLAAAHIGLGESYRRQGDSASSIGALIRAVQADSSLVYSNYCHTMLASLAIGHPLEGELSYGDILLVFQRAVATELNSAEIHYNLGRVLAMGHHYEQAMAEYQHALVLNPMYPQPYVGLGEVYLELGHPEQALTAFQRATGMEWPAEEAKTFSVAPITRSSAYSGLARAQIAMNQFDQAQLMVKLAIESADPFDFFLLSGISVDVAEAYKDRAGIFIEQQRFDLAARAYQYLIEVYILTEDESHDHAFARLMLAICYYRLGLQALEQGKREEARGLLERAQDEWNVAYKLQVQSGKEIGENWLTIRQNIESAHRKATSRWRFW